MFMVIRNRHVTELLVTLKNTMKGHFCTRGWDLAFLWALLGLPVSVSLSLFHSA